MTSEMPAAAFDEMRTRVQGLTQENARLREAGSALVERVMQVLTAGRPEQISYPALEEATRRFSELLASAEGGADRAGADPEGGNAAIDHPHGPGERGTAAEPEHALAHRELMDKHLEAHDRQFEEYHALLVKDEGDIRDLENRVTALESRRDAPDRPARAAAPIVKANDKAIDAAGEVIYGVTWRERGSVVVARQRVLVRLALEAALRELART